MQSQSISKKSALAVGCTAHVVQDGMSATVYVLMPILAQTFGLSYAQVGLFKGLKSTSQAVLEMCSGVVTERLGECRILALGLILTAVGYALLAVAPSALMVMICLLIIGAGTAFQHAPSSALIISAFPIDARRGPLGLYNSSGDVGKLLFTGGFSLAIGAGLAWQNVSLIYSAITLVSGIAIAILTRALSKALAEQQAAGQNGHPSDVSLGWGILNWRSYAMLIAIVSVDTMIQTATLVFVAFLMLAKGLPLMVATGATVILLAGGVFGKASCGYLADKLGVKPAFILIQVVTALGLVGIVYAPAWLALVLLLPVGAVVQGSSSITYGFAADLIHPRRMARGYALLYATASFASAIGPVAFGVLADSYDIQAAIIAMAVISLLAAPTILLLPAQQVIEPSATS